MSNKYNRFKGYQAPRPGVEAFGDSADAAVVAADGSVAVGETVPEDTRTGEEVIAGLEAIAAGINLSLYEKDPGLEGFGDWVSNKIKSLTEFFGNLAKDFKLAIAKWSVKDWNSLSDENKAHLIKRAKLTFYAYNPQYIDKMQVIVDAGVAIAKLVPVGFKLPLISEVEAAAAPGIKAMGEIITALGGTIPTPEPVEEGEQPEPMANLNAYAKEYNKVLKAYVPKEGSVLADDTMSKLVSYLQKNNANLDKINDAASRLARAESQHGLNRDVEEQEDRATAAKIAMAFMVFGVVFSGGLFNLLIYVIWAMQDNAIQDKATKRNAAGNESFDADGNPIVAAAEVADINAALADPAAADSAPVVAATPGLEAGEGEANADVKPEDEATAAVATTEGSTEPAAAAELEATAEPTTAEPAAVEPAATTTADENVEPATVEPVVAAAPVDVTVDADANVVAAEPAAAAVVPEVVEDVAATNSINLEDDEYVAEIEQLNVFDSKVATIDADVAEIEEVSAGLEALIFDLEQTRLAGGISRHTYDMIKRHSIDSYGARVGVTTTRPGMEHFNGNSVASKLALTAAGLEDASETLKQVMEVLKNALQALIDGAKELVAFIFDHQVRLNKRLADLKERSAKAGSNNIRVKLPGKHAAALQVGDTAASAASIAKATTGATQYIAYLVATGSAWNSLTGVYSASNPDVEAINSMNSTLVDKVLLPAAQLDSIPNLTVVVTADDAATDGTAKLVSCKVEMDVIEDTGTEVEVSSINYATVEKLVQEYSKATDAWKADSRNKVLLGTVGGALGGMMNWASKIESMNDAEKALINAAKAHFRATRPVLSLCTKPLNNLRKAADAAIAYLELSLATGTKVAPAAAPAAVKE